MTRAMPDEIARRLARPLRFTRWAVIAERAAVAFWPLASVVMAAAALVLSGGVAFLPAWAGQSLIATLALLGLASLVTGARRFRLPTGAEILDRLDATLPGAPISALTDTQAIGANDLAARAVWAAHLARQAARLDGLQVPAPQPGLARRDPFGLRLIAATALAVALLFGPGTRTGDLIVLMPGSAEAALSAASWEGWIEPPSYTGKPTLYLSDQPPGALSVPVGSHVTIRLYGKLGALDVRESFTGQPAPEEPTPTRAFKIGGDGVLSIGQDRWEISALPDTAPEIAVSGELTRTLDGEMRLPFTARDDYGISTGQARLSLDLARVPRTYGLTAAPEPRDDLVVDLPMPYRGARTEVEEQLVENLAEHPWAGLPITVTLAATDAAGQSAMSAPAEITLPGRRFLDPLARAIIEQRRDLFWTIDNAPRVARILRAVSYRPEEVFSNTAHFLELRGAVETLESPELSPDLRDAVVRTLWEIAVEIEEGNLADALEALRRARERLTQAMRQGATPEELSELMDEYREAMRDYMRELAKRDPTNQTDEPDRGERQQELTQNELQALADRIQELMDEGRMAEAQDALDQLQNMMENIEMTEGQPGAPNGPGEEAMRELGNALREQQGLSDEAFRELQRQLNPGAEGGPETESGGAEDGSENGQALADRQRALEEGLRDQRDRLPGAGSEPGEEARDDLDRAGRAMEGAAEALEEGDIASALDRQAEAMEALREGMRGLREAMRQENQSGASGQQGRVAGQPGERQQPDPLGRNPGGSGATATDSPLAETEDAYRRAQELMDELRRRAGEADRPELERDYLRRLLEQF